MGNHQDTPVDVDPHALENARHFWHVFTKATTFGVVAIMILLGLMAAFLIG